MARLPQPGTPIPGRGAVRGESEPAGGAGAGGALCLSKRLQVTQWISSHSGGSATSPCASLHRMLLALSGACFPHSPPFCRTGAG